MLHKAGKRIKFWDEPAEDAQLVHQIERWEDSAGFAQDRAETDVRVGRRGDVARDERNRFADE